MINIIFLQDMEELVRYKEKIWIQTYRWIKQGENMKRRIEQRLKRDTNLLK